MALQQSLGAPASPTLLEARGGRGGGLTPAGPSERGVEFRRMRPLLLLFLLSLMVGAASAPADARLLAFKSPSGNLTCVMSSARRGFAQCEDRSRRNGGGVSVDARGRVQRYDVGYDDLAGRRFVLRYGHSRRLSDFRCTSRRMGMRCVHLRSGGGFKLSRGRTRLV